VKQGNRLSVMPVEEVVEKILGMAGTGQKNTCVLMGIISLVRARAGLGVELC